MKFGFLVSAMALLLSVQSAEAADRIVEDGEIAVNFYDGESSNKSLFAITYPGMGSFVVKGVQVARGKSPDCLVLVNNGAELNQSKVKTFLSKLRVGQGNRPSDELRPSLKFGTFVYFLKNLGTYVTVVEVSTREGSFTELRDKYLGEEAINLRLVFSKACGIVHSEVR